MTLELQLFAFLAGYAAYVWDTVVFLLVLFQVQLELLESYEVPCCGRL